MPEETRPIFMTTHREWVLLDCTDGTGKDYTLPPGRYEVERIPCPLGHDCNYLVLKGTKIGVAEGALRQWAPKERAPHGDPAWNIEFEE